MTENIVTGIWRIVYLFQVNAEGLGERQRGIPDLKDSKLDAGRSVKNFF